jgi:hypothetical protein
MKKLTASKKQKLWIIRILVMNCSIYLFYISSSIVYGQCSGFPATVTEVDCADFPSLTSNSTVDGGQTRAVCATSREITTYSNINLNGGIIRLCGNARISGSFNSGTIVVSCGATLECPSGLLLNNAITIVNYGTVNVTGNLTFQNNNNSFFNELSTSKLFVSGNLTFPQNNGQNAYLKNNGYIKVGNSFNALDGGFTCLGENSIIDCVNFRYIQNCGGPARRFTYASATGTCIIRYSETGNVRAELTTSSSITIQKATGATESFSGCGSWGAATVINDTPEIDAPEETKHYECPTPNCFLDILALPIRLIQFEAIPEQNKIRINWTTISESNNAFFTIEKSTNGQDWKSIGTIEGADNSFKKTRYEFYDYNPISGIQYYRLKQTDFDGNSLVFNIISLNFSNKNPNVIAVYPNPAKDYVAIEIAENEKLQEETFVRFISPQGKIVLELVIFQETKTIVDLKGFIPGVYFVEIQNSESKTQMKLVKN